MRSALWSHLHKIYTQNWICMLLYMEKKMATQKLTVFEGEKNNWTRTKIFFMVVKHFRMRYWIVFGKIWFSWFSVFFQVDRFCNVFSLKAELSLACCRTNKLNMSAYLLQSLVSITLIKYTTIFRITFRKYFEHQWQSRLNFVIRQTLKIKLSTLIYNNNIAIKLCDKTWII